MIRHKPNLILTDMKRLILLTVCLLTLNLAFSQSGHIKFMGVEVNGQVSTLDQRLATKGFSKTKDGLYKGKFSGYEVKLKLQTSVKSKVVYSITVMFGDNITKDELSEMAASLREKYSEGTPFENGSSKDASQVGVELPEGTIMIDFSNKTLSYIDKANLQKNAKESKADL